MRGTIPTTHYHAYAIVKLLHPFFHHSLVDNFYCAFVSVCGEVFSIKLHCDDVFVAILINNDQSFIFFGNKNENFLLSIIVHTDDDPCPFVFLHKFVNLA